MPPDELWLKLSEYQPFEIFDFPRKGADGLPIGQVRIHVLRQEQHGMAKVMAQAALHKDAARYGIAKLGKDDIDSPVIQSALGDLVAQELLAMALHSTTPMPGSEQSDRPTYPFLFYGAEDIRKKLSAAEVAVLFNAYILTQDKYGPFERNLSDEDIDSWVRRLSEGGSKFPLAALPWLPLVELASSLAARMSLLSNILESQYESLPTTLQSDLKPFCLGMSSSGERPSGATQSYWESSAEGTGIASRMADEAMARESAGADSNE